MHSFVASKNVKWCHLIWPTLYMRLLAYYFTFYFLLYFFDRHHVRGYCLVVTCSLEITVSALYIAMLSANKWNEMKYVWHCIILFYLTLTVLHWVKTCIQGPSLMRLQWQVKVFYHVFRLFYFLKMFLTLFGILIFFLNVFTAVVW